MEQPSNRNMGSGAGPPFSEPSEHSREHGTKPISEATRGICCSKSCNLKSESKISTPNSSSRTSSFPTVDFKSKSYCSMNSDRKLPENTVRQEQLELLRQLTARRKTSNTSCFSEKRRNLSKHVIVTNCDNRKQQRERNAAADPRSRDSEPTDTQFLENSASTKNVRGRSTPIIKNNSADTVPKTPTSHSTFNLPLPEAAVSGMSKILVGIDPQIINEKYSSSLRRTDSFCCIMEKKSFHDSVSSASNNTNLPQAHKNTSLSLQSSTASNANLSSMASSTFSKSFSGRDTTGRAMPSPGEWASVMFRHMRQENGHKNEWSKPTVDGIASARSSFYVKQDAISPLRPHQLTAEKSKDRAFEVSYNPYYTFLPEYSNKNTFTTNMYEKYQTRAMNANDACLLKALAPQSNLHAQNKVTELTFQNLCQQKVKDETNNLMRFLPNAVAKYITYFQGTSDEDDYNDVNIQSSPYLTILRAFSGLRENARTQESNNMMTTETTQSKLSAFSSDEISPTISSQELNNQSEKSDFQKEGNCTTRLFYDNDTSVINEENTIENRQKEKYTTESKQQPLSQDTPASKETSVKGCMRREKTEQTNEILTDAANINTLQIHHSPTKDSNDTKEEREQKKISLEQVKIDDQSKISCSLEASRRVNITEEHQEDKDSTEIMHQSLSLVTPLSNQNSGKECHRESSGKPYNKLTQIHRSKDSNVIKGQRKLEEVSLERFKTDDQSTATLEVLKQDNVKERESFIIPLKRERDVSEWTLAAQESCNASLISLSHFQYIGCPSCASSFTISESHSDTQQNEYVNPHQKSHSERELESHYADAQQASNLDQSVTSRDSKPKEKTQNNRQLPPEKSASHIVEGTENSREDADAQVTNEASTQEGAVVPDQPSNLRDAQPPKLRDTAANTHGTAGGSQVISAPSLSHPSSENEQRGSRRVGSPVLRSAAHQHKFMREPFKQSHSCGKASLIAENVVAPSNQGPCEPREATAGKSLGFGKAVLPISASSSSIREIKVEEKSSKNAVDKCPIVLVSWDQSANEEIKNELENAEAKRSYSLLFWNPTASETRCTKRTFAKIVNRIMSSISASVVQSNTIETSEKAVGCQSAPQYCPKATIISKISACVDKKETLENKSQVSKTWSESMKNKPSKVQHGDVNADKPKSGFQERKYSGTNNLVYTCSINTQFKERQYDAFGEPRLEILEKRSSIASEGQNETQISKVNITTSSHSIQKFEKVSVFQSESPGTINSYYLDQQSTTSKEDIVNSKVSQCSSSKSLQVDCGKQQRPNNTSLPAFTNVSSTPQIFNSCKSLFTHKISSNECVKLVESKKSLPVIIKKAMPHTSKTSKEWSMYLEYPRNARKRAVYSWWKHKQKSIDTHSKLFDSLGIFYLASSDEEFSSEDDYDVISWND